jgi:hypothetical protein
MDLNEASTIEIAFGPESLIMAIAPAPDGVAKAIIVSF